MNFLIDFKQGTAEQDITDYLALYNCVLVKNYTHYDDVYLVTSSTLPPVTDLVDSVIEDSANPIQLLSTQIDMPAPTSTVTFNSADSHNWWKTASLASPDFSNPVESHAVRGHGVKVYIMDSGIEQTHVEFAGVDVTLLHSFTSDFTDTTGHGTALASVISGVTCGLTSAKLAVLKVFDATVPTHQSDLLSAFDAIMTDFAASGQTCSVLNMSWSIAKNEYIESKINILIDAGVFCVTAAGNDGHPIDDVTPASMDKVLTIGSYSENLEPSDFSNYTNTSTVSVTPGAVNTGALDGWAPGENIYTAAVGGGYTSIAGTSVSAAIHSGALAYNLASLLNDANNVPPCYMNSPNIMGIVKSSALGRIGLLHLTAQYDGSVNKISTYFSRYEDYPVQSGTEVKIRVGQEICLKMFTQTSVKSVLLSAPLPDGVTIENGIMLGHFTSVNGNYELVTIDMDVTLQNDSVVPVSIKMWVMAVGFDEMTPSPTTDPILAITAEVCDTCCSTGAHSCNYQGCTSTCMNCNEDPKGPPSCICTTLDVC